ncbi:hypothetical protein [Actinobaculum sp. 313]|uniref:hypothetical protein n=1 Tax=Actinobaculum sp. 313 TaxID=2495645 RepID=UPI000D529284|nr:hypothetical protein [Actinobaculum sp. 313]AWE41686.1 hypothetical protein DDD63_01700 [Actinobaculum sp. 313]
MGIEGYVVAFVTALLLVYVIPYYYRRTMVLAEARIDERYAEDLRMLRLPAGQVAEHAADGRGAHGTVFFRQPEVVMSTERGSQGVVPAGKSTRKGSLTRGALDASNAVSAATDVRALAKARARRRARISQRVAKQQRGLLGGGALGVLAVVFWILAAATAFPVGVALAATAVTGVYFVGLGYIMSEMNKASQADRETITEINAKLGTGSMRREASGTARRPSAPRSRTSRSTPADSGSSDSRKGSGVIARSAGMPRRDGKAARPYGQAPVHAAEQAGVSRRGAQSAVSSARKAQGATYPGEREAQAGRREQLTSKASTGAADGRAEGDFRVDAPRRERGDRVERGSHMPQRGGDGPSARAPHGISLTLDESFVGAQRRRRVLQRLIGLSGVLRWLYRQRMPWMLPVTPSNRARLNGVWWRRIGLPPSKRRRFPIARSV